MNLVHKRDVSVLGVEHNVRLDGAKVELNSLVLQRFGAFRELYGEPCADYKTKIERGESATTPMSAKDCSVRHFSPATCTKVYRTSPTGRIQTLTRKSSRVGLMPAAAVQPDLLLKAEQALSSKFYGLYQTGPSTDLGVVAVELSETVQMLNAPFKHLVKAVSKRYSQSRGIADRILRSPAIRKLPTQKRLVEARRQWHNAYLETYFGWLPLISELQGIAQDLEKLLTKPPLVQVRVAGSADKVSGGRFSDGVDGVTGISSLSSYHRQSISIRGAYQPVLSLDTEFSSPVSAVADVLPALWEAVPYSWLTDYVFNIGHVLSADQSVQTLDWAWLSRTEHYTRDDRVDVAFKTVSVPPEQLLSWDERPGSFTVRHRIINRSAPGNIPPPVMGYRHKPQTRFAALAAVASVVDMRRVNLKQSDMFSALINNL